ncbi:MAG: DNA-3-methyladenine glycosylase [Chloroflexi bacterium]|nr:DNA-3-methyladenine glycosylase [Chloroflexota bacterium]
MELAPALLGLRLMRESAEGRSGGLIVETEAYGGPEDRASHARAGHTRRTAPMFGPPGHAYVYLIYGLHSCLNVVAEAEGVAGAVLIRALRPVLGLEMIRARRGRPRDADSVLAAGPARVCQALAVDRSLDGHDLTRGEALWIEEPGGDGPERLLTSGVLSGRIIAGPRIGVAYAGEGWAERRWRFGVAGDPSLSRPFPPLSRPSPSSSRPDGR